MKLLIEVEIDEEGSAGELFEQFKKHPRGYEIALAGCRWANRPTDRAHA